MSERRPWYKWWPGQYQNDEDLDQWPLQAHGLYRLMLDKQWQRGKLPTKMSTLSRILSSDPRHTRDLFKSFVCKKFVDTGDGFMYNEALERERQDADEQSLRSSRGGKKGAEIRWGGHSPPNSTPNGESVSNIEEEKKKRKEENKDSSDKKSDHSKAVKYFCEAYEAKFGHKYDFKRAKDGALVKRLLNTYEISGFEKLTDQLFKSTDSFIETTDRGISILSACSTKLMQETQRKTKDAMDSKCKEAFNRIQFCEATGRIDEHQASVFRKELHGDLTTPDEMLAKLHDQRMAE